VVNSHEYSPPCDACDSVNFDGFGAFPQELSARSQKTLILKIKNRTFFSWRF